ncbi:MAG TPA: hypothetical protein VFY04_05815 [Solirubrobacterales bacterium]|nr:hypothetical protein [Solirubrobacterales bacterium]
MSAGLPGLGLGGLFFIFSALLAPFPELWRTLRGRSDLASWRAIGRQLVQALVMVAAIDLTLRLTYVVLSALGAGDPPAADEATVLPLNLIGITTGLLVLVLCSAKLAELALRAGGGGLPRVPDVVPRVAPLRAATFGAAAMIAWIALLATGASELSPLERPQREQIASRPEQDAGAMPQQAVVKRRPHGENDPSPIATEATGGGRNRAAATTNATAAPDSGDGGAGIAPSPTLARPKAPPPKPAGSAPVAVPKPASTPAPPPNAAADAGGPPESAGPPEGVPGSERAGPAAEPPPQAPAKGLREAQ